MSRLLDPRRDFDKECGYPLNITTEDYALAYKRRDIASRVVSIYPEESWNLSPTVYETEEEIVTKFEESWDAIQQQFSVFSILLRADILSGIGAFGILLLGLDDGKELDKPVDGINKMGESEPTGEERKLIYLRPFSESVVQINRLENDINNPRYGLPLEYSIQFADTAIGQTVKESTTTSRNVHWSRVIHLCDNRTNSDVFGSPRMEKVFERLLDLRKVAAGSGEMFWKGGFPGFSLEASPGLEEQVEFDPVATREEMEKYMNGLQRYIATIGMTVKGLQVQIADPNHHVEVQIRLIAMATGIPWRILMGVEIGQLAGDQDIESWNKRLDKRRKEYVTPYILRPFVDRLIALGVLPQPKKEGKYIVDWPDLNTPKDQDKADVSDKLTNAIAKYVASGADILIPPFHFLTLVLKMKPNEANAVLEAAGLQQTEGGLLADIREEEAEVAAAQAEAELAAKSLSAGAPPARGGNGFPNRK